jgi:hypothetical protein
VTIRVVPPQPAPTAVAVPRAEREPEVVEPAPAAQPAPRPSEVPKRPTKPAEPRPQRDVHAELAQRLRARELVLRDLESTASAGLDALRAATRESDPERRERALDPLLAKIDALAIDPPLVQSRLKRISTALESLAGKLPAEKMSELEAKYFDVRARYRPSLGEAECRAVGHAALALEHELETAKHASR